MELHAGRNTEWNENRSHVFGTGGNLAVGTLAIYICSRTLHSVKKLPLHSCAVRL